MIDRGIGVIQPHWYGSYVPAREVSMSVRVVGTGQHDGDLKIVTCVWIDWSTNSQQIYTFKFNRTTGSED